MLIGISGKARTGKDTVGVIFKKELFGGGKGEFKLMEYSRSLKEHLRKNFNITKDQLYGDLKEVPDRRYRKQNIKEEIYWTPREILQAYGEFFRSIDNDFWVKEVFKNIFENLIITDVRHKNEVKAVKDRGGYHIRIYRDHGLEVNGTTHISETALDFVDVYSTDKNSIYTPDFMIKNNSSIQNLTNAIKDVIIMIYKLEEFNRNKIISGG